MPATPANSTQPFSCPLCASHELLTTRKYCHASIPFRTFVRHLPCLVLATTPTPQSATNHPHICTSIYLFRLSLFSSRRRLEDIGWRLRSHSPPRVAPFRFTPALYLVGHLAISRLLETTHRAQSETGIRKNLTWEETLLSCLANYDGFFTSSVQLGSLLHLFHLSYYISENPHPRRRVTTIPTPTLSPSLSFVPHNSILRPRTPASFLLLPPLPLYKYPLRAFILHSM